MSPMKGEGLSCLQVVVGGVQTHLSFVGEAYPSFYLAGDGEKKSYWDNVNIISDYQSVFFSDVYVASFEF